MASYKHTRRSHGVHKKRRVTKRHKNTLRKSRSRIMRGGVRITYKDGRIYDGDIQNGKANGKGKMSWSDDGHAYVYDGEWVNDEINGKGKMSWSDDGRAYVYEGMWKNGKKNGIGNMTSWPKDMEHSHEWVEDMTIYDGEWVNDEINGKGKYTWPNGDFYEGDWNNGNAHGYGTMKSSNGNLYKGEWNKGKKINGTIQWGDGKEFRGLSNEHLSMSNPMYNSLSRKGTPTKQRRNPN